jgi:hypothetical protein
MQKITAMSRRTSDDPIASGEWFLDEAAQLGGVSGGDRAGSDIGDMIRLYGGRRGWWPQLPSSSRC